MLEPINFAIYYVGDAYSTANKIMGRQSAGKSFIKGVARSWPNETVYGIGLNVLSAQEMLRQLQEDVFTGQLKWSTLPDWQTVSEVGALYHPAPPASYLAFARNLQNPSAFSFMGVTHTISSKTAMDQLADLIMPPFKPWDALICTSQCALDFAIRIQDEARSWLSTQIGATRYNVPQQPVIPLGVNCPTFAPQSEQRCYARKALKLNDEETVFLFAGRLSFHGKANPASMYHVLEQTAKHSPLVCIEAGVFPHDTVRAGFVAAQKALAPSVRFIWVDGNDEVLYRQAWQGADVFVSLSDNIQETFGLTPVEAMAAGLPVVVSDWNGYKDTVRDGVDGYRVPTVLPPAGVGGDLALRHALALDTYDFYIGRTSLATVVDPEILVAAFTRLATQPELRARMGAAGLVRAQNEFDWPIILQRYAELAKELGRIRTDAGPQPTEPWPTRADPFHRFAHFSTKTLGGNWLVTAKQDAVARLNDLLSLAMVNYAFDAALLPKEHIVALLDVLQKQGGQTVNALLAAAGVATPVGVRSLMWLWKFDLLKVMQG